MGNTIVKCTVCNVQCVTKFVDIIRITGTVIKFFPKTVSPVMAYLICNQRIEQSSFRVLTLSAILKLNRILMA